jgi:hypothetical protein
MRYGLRMDLVYIYGPPAAGKLTVAKELSRLTGYKLFHNHLSIDCVRPVFEFGTEPFWRLVFQIRRQVIEEAAAAGVSLIFTSVYNNPTDLPLFQGRADAVERHGGRVFLVQLKPSKEALLSRIESPDRVAMNKLASAEQLLAEFELHELFAPIPGRESLTIDNSALPAAEVAARIAAAL